MNTYERALGHAVYMQQSEIFFSRNTGQELKDQITNTLKVFWEWQASGLAFMIKNQMFGVLRDRH